MKKNSILIVDDSRVSLMHLLQILQDDYIVHTAESGPEAIQVAKVAKPDLIMTDVVMPMMDGYETLVALKDIYETKNIPVIFVTSLGQDGDEEKGLKMGAVDYITKPYNPAIVKLRVSLQLRLIEQMRQIQHLSMADVQTGMSNRTHFEKRLREEWQRAGTGNYEIGLMLINIDRFKKFNRLNGLDNGDAALLKIAKVIDESTPNPGDLAARWSDDGFAVMLTRVSNSDCNTAAEKLRQEAARLDFVDSSLDPMMTLSIGAHTINPNTPLASIEKLISDVDSSLYLAKELGRNMVVMHS